MRIKQRYISFHANEKILKHLNKLDIEFFFEDRDHRTSIPNNFLEFFLYEDDPRFEDRKHRLRAHSDCLLIQEMTEFSSEDEENAHWFLINTGHFGYPQPEQRYLEVTYDMSLSCPHCTIDKRQVAPFRFRTAPNAKHSMAVQLNWVFDELFVRQNTINVWQEEHLTGLRFSSPVIHKNNVPVEGILQAHVDTVLPCGLLSENLVTEPCLSCGRHRFNYPTRGAMTFRKEVFDGQPDFVRSAEWFGSGGEAHRPIIVSKRVREISAKHKLKGASFTPVFLMG